MTHLTDNAKHIVDAIAATIAGLTMLDHLPSYAAGLTIVWLTLQIGNFVYEKFIKRD